MRTIFNFSILCLFCFLIEVDPANSQSGIMLSGQNIVLKDSARVKDKIIYVKDLFLNAGEKGEIAIAYSPSPGKKATFDASWLYRVAKGHQLKWRPINRHHKIIVERASTIISQEKIAKEILIALGDQDISGDLEVELSNRALRLYVPENQPTEIGFDSLNYNPQNRRFVAMIFAPVDDPSAKRLRITGRLHITNEVPVPNRRILRQEIITKKDIKWIKVRSRRLQTDTIMNEEDLIGKSPRRGLRQGLPVRLTSVRKPILVSKGSLVTIILWSPKMVLTAQGKAIIGGSDGDIIQVKNTQSNSIVEAKVISAGRVMVRPTAQLAMK